ncbi:DUF4401 domain-containing protein [Leeuwenhoekiella nanhaiensis]|uniref:DUF4401 domain-containing protein n=1 Tax=Leeuwenhoekiella nanhaiensis TaxID=1655491 RepID=A0A2G1VUK2_9FLAO|nr:DUF4401 domain-containing protein [Leeuwenhoekiella nanhaiensis]PHQ30411.1 hypothetical protein CJ305_05485 [Leeuwenhoekiella nanhaiensis]
MKTREDIKLVIDYFKSNPNESISFDENEIESAYIKEDNQPLAVKILSVFGSILANLAFFAFLVLTGIFDIEIMLFVFGVIGICLSIYISRLPGKFLYDTLSASVYLSGYVLIGIAINTTSLPDNIINFIFIFSSLTCIALKPNYILTFISILLLNSSLLALLFQNNLTDLLHLYVSILTFLNVYFFLKEAQIITYCKGFSKLYNPLRIGFLFSLLIGLFLLGVKGILSLSPNYIWLSSLVSTVSIMYLVSKILRILNVTQVKHKWFIYSIVLVLLIATALSPAISGALLITLLGHLVNYKTGFVIGIIAFIYFVGQYYYDLNFNLLTKSILMFSAGILFLLFYVLTRKNLSGYEDL